MRGLRLNSMPLLLRVIIAIVLGLALGQIVPLWWIRVMNTFNGLFNQLLGFVIPLIIVGYVAPAIADVGRGAKKLLILTCLVAYLATVISGLIGYFCGASLFPMLIGGLSHTCDEVAGGAAEPYFTISIPPVMDVMTALFMSFLLGIGVFSSKAKVLKSGLDEFKCIVTMAIGRVVIPLLPFYIFGMFQNMSAEGNVSRILTSFAGIVAIIFLLTLLLLLMQYVVAGAVCGRNPFRLLKTMLPAYMTALGTASSAATIPVTLRQTIENGVDKGIAGFVIPLCATIHMSGSMTKIVSCAVAIMLIDGIPFDFTLMIGFILLLAVTMVAAPGVPGGSIMAAIGVLDIVLGFSPEQQSMMITLYIAMDSFGTACNVTGDGALALIIDRFRHRI